MSDREVFDLQKEIENLKRQRHVRVPSATPLLAFGLMAMGIVLSVFGQPGIGYKFGLVGFAGFAIIYGMQSFLTRREKNIEYRIREIERKLEELQHQ